MVLSMFVEHVKNYCCNAAQTCCNNYRQILQCCMYCWSLLYTIIALVKELEKLSNHVW